LVEAEVAGAVGGHKGFIVGPAICHGEACHKSLQGASNETPPLHRRRRPHLTLGCPAPLPVPDHPPAARGRLTRCPKSLAEAERHAGQVRLEGAEIYNYTVFLSFEN